MKELRISISDKAMQNLDRQCVEQGMVDEQYRKLTQGSIVTVLLENLKV